MELECGFEKPPKLAVVVRSKYSPVETCAFWQTLYRDVQRKRTKDNVLVELQLSIFGETIFSGPLSPSASSECQTPFTRVNRRSNCIACSDFTKMPSCPDRTNVIRAHLHIVFPSCTCNFILETLKYNVFLL